MSLLCGVYERRAPAAGPLDAMIGALPGRGRAEVWSSGALGMARRELSAHPPRREAAGRVRRMAADVRLDNRSEVSAALGLAGTAGAGVSDCELVARAYERWGRACPRRLVGDYAFAIWDAAVRRLFCARDAVGARPFYYAALPERFVFASDLAAVLAAPGVDDGLDEDYVAAYLSRRMPGGAYTFFRAVRSLPPGHSLTVDARAERVERWWRPEDTPPAPRGSDDDCAGAFMELCTRAVRDRLRGAREPGVHLSGGLDSSGVAVLAAREQCRVDGPLHAFCWHPPPADGLAGDAAAEYGRIEAVCAQEGLRPLYHAPSVRHGVALLRRDGARTPNRDGTLDVEALVQRSAAARGVDVLLAGWGGDEGVSFNGRGYYAGLLRQGRLVHMMRAAREETRHPLRHLFVHAVLAQFHPLAPVAMRRMLRGRPPRPKTFVHPALARRARRLHRPPRPTGVRSMQLALLGHGHLAQRIEDWAASGARRGIEYRYPLLDRRLLEFALGLPPEQFRRGRWGRWLMRHALRDVLPSSVCWRPSKREAARVGPAKPVLAGVLSVVRRQLAARGAPPSRAKYVDMPRLLRRLDAHGPETLRQPGKVQAALQFLDW